MNIKELNLEVMDLFERLSKSQDHQTHVQISQYDKVLKRLSILEKKLDEMQIDKILKSIESINATIAHINFQFSEL